MRRPTFADTQVLIVDDHPFMRRGLAQTINDQAGLDVCGEAGSVAEALQIMETCTPQLAVVDISLGAESGIELIQAAVDTTIAIIQSGIPIARVELLGAMLMDAVNKFSKLDNKVAPTLMFEFHGTKAYVAEQVAAVEAIAKDYGGSDFRWAHAMEERNKLWQARHDAYFAGLQTRPGSRAVSTDVCVPISRLAECIAETEQDMAAASMPIHILGHVGDGNFHLMMLIDPDDKDELHESHAINERLVHRALRLEGTCTGEHGVGMGKMDFLVAEHGDAISVMRMIKKTLDPDNIMNPGKILKMN